VSASIRTTAEAEQQISLATEWWRANRRDSAEQFETELAKAFSLLSRMPNIGKL
jgi:plasmid stabilization system protein ParE